MNLSHAKTKWFQRIAIFILPFILYINSASNGYNMDDELYGTPARKITDQGVNGFHKIFTKRTFVGNDYDYEYRPVPLLTFVLQFHTLGDAAQTSHLISILIYSFSCVLLFTLLCKWLPEYDTWLPFFICALFAVHPLHTEIVDSIKSRDELLLFLFLVSGLLSAWRYYETKKKINILWFALFFILAMYCKSTARIYFFITPIAFYFFTDMPLKKIIVYCMSFIIAVIAFYFIIKHALPKMHRLSYQHENAFNEMQSNLFMRMPTGLYVMGWYLYLHILPINLAYYYGYSYVPLAGWDNLWVWISVIVYAAIIFYTTKHLRKRDLTGFGCVVFLMNVLAYSNIFKKAPGMMAERFMFVASLGFSIVIITLLYNAFKKPVLAAFADKNSKNFLLCVVIICTAYSVRSAVRNKDWENKETLYAHDMQYLGNSAKANMMYGELMSKKEILYREKVAAIMQNNGGNPSLIALYEDSIKYCLNIAMEKFKTALEISPTFSTATYNLGILYFRQGHLPEAKYYMQISAPTYLHPEEVYNALGVLYAREHKTDSAILFFKRSIDKDSAYLLAYKELSKALMEKKDTATAIKLLEAGTQRDTLEPMLYAELANIAIIRRDTPSTIRYCELASERKPLSESMLSFLISYYQNHNNSQKAAYYIDKYNNLYLNDKIN